MFESLYRWPRVADLFGPYLYHIENTNKYIMEYIWRLLLGAVLTQHLEHQKGSENEGYSTHSILLQPQEARHQC